jgi:hypothetical protein
LSTSPRFRSPLTRPRHRFAASSSWHKSVSRPQRSAAARPPCQQPS